MIKNPFFKTSNLKKILLILFSLIIILVVSVLITTQVIKSQPDNIQQSINDRFNKIKVQLEFEGLTKSVKEKTNDYSMLFDGYSNIIITDDTGKILYKVNNGYISEKDKFLALVDPWQSNGYGSDIAFLIDSKNNIKYSTQLDIFLNTNKLRKQSSENTLSKALFSAKKDTDDNLGDNLTDKEITNSNGSSYIISSETNIVMNYAYVASKGYNLYSLYDSTHQYNNYYIFTNLLNTVKHYLLITTLVFLILFWILLPIWVFKDAQNQHCNATIWGMITFILNILGLAIYLVSRSRNVKCISCNKTIKNYWLLCPYCGEKINAVKTVEHK